MPVLIIEGCDGTGKSTLAARAAEYARETYGKVYEVRELHYGVPPYDPESPLTIGEQAMNALLEPLTDFVFASQFLVIDRFHWGEPVYAPTFRADSCVDPMFGTLTHDEFFHVENWVRRVGGVVGYCYAPPGIIMERVLREREGVPDLIADSGDVQNKTLQILDRYEKLHTYLTHEHRGPRRAENIRQIELLKPSDTDIWAKRLVRDAVTRAMDVYEEFRASQRPELYVPIGTSL